MPLMGRINITAFVFSMALHAMVFMLVGGVPFTHPGKPKERLKEQIILLQVLPPSKDVSTQKQASSAIHKPLLTETPTPTLSADTSTSQPRPAKAAASMAAPPAPSSQEWAFAARYTHKNSKGYRYSWGQQVRSMMGTAVEGPDQGFVRLRVEIAPDGTLAKLDTLWTTSAVAEQLARKAIETMPPLPPTPTGKPLIFEKTISFMPFATDGPPSYKDDCSPDPLAFRNPFVWDGKSPQARAESTKVEKPDSQAMQECLRQLPKDTIEAETARDQRELERWGWTR